MMPWTFMRFRARRCSSSPSSGVMPRACRREWAGRDTSGSKTAGVLLEKYFRKRVLQKRNRIQQHSRFITRRQVTRTVFDHFKISSFALLFERCLVCKSEQLFELISFAKLPEIQDFQTYHRLFPHRRHWQKKFLTSPSDPLSTGSHQRAQQSRSVSL